MYHFDKYWERLWAEELELLILIGLVAVASISVFWVFGRPLVVSRLYGKPALTVVRNYGLGDSASQLRHVMAATFYKKKVMSKAEYRIFKIVETEIANARKGYRVLSQTSLGEIIGSEDKKAFYSVNSKRVDVLVIGPYGDPLAAIEYQGQGHHQGSSAARDAIKREALRRAGIHYVEILHDHSDDEVTQLVRRVL